jgi:hypothetical protein
VVIWAAWDCCVTHVRPENAKSKKERMVPIGTTRLRTLLEFLRIDGQQQEKARKHVRVYAGRPCGPEKFRDGV